MPPEYHRRTWRKRHCGAQGICAAGRNAHPAEPCRRLRFTQDLGVKATNVVRGVASKDFYSPGSHVEHDPRYQESALAYGMPANLTLWSEAESRPGMLRRSIRRSPLSRLRMCWLRAGCLGEKYLTGKAALLDVPMGSGHIVMFGFRPQYRSQSYQNFKLFFNAMAYR